MLIDCALVPALNGKPGICDLNRCSKPLPPRRRRWCSDECSSAYHRETYGQHDWNSARERALERDGRRCVKCGDDGGVERQQAIVEGTLGPEPPMRHGKWHRHAGSLAEFDRWHSTAAKIRRAHPTRALEVNHIVPRKGAGYSFGCWNHLDNLETLCHACHVKVTNAQRRSRAKIAC